MHEPVKPVWTDTSVCVGHPDVAATTDEVGLLQAMDTAGIQKAWLFAYRSIATHDFEAGNDQVARIVRRYPDRFEAIGLVNPFQAFPMVDQLLDQGFVGIKIISGWGNWLTIENVRRLIGPIAEALDRHGRSLSVTLEGHAPTRGGNVWIPMVLRELAPELPIIVDRCTSAHAWEDYLALARTDPSLWFGIGALPQRLLGRIIESLGPERLLLSSWYPETDPDLVIAQLDRAAPSGVRLGEILNTNAQCALAGGHPTPAESLDRRDRISGTNS